MTTKTPEYYLEEISTVAAADKYKLTPSYIARLARTHIIRARKFGRDWIIDENALRDYLAQPRKTGPKPHSRKKPRKTKSIAPLPDAEGEHHAATKAYGNNQTIS